MQYRAYRESDLAQSVSLLNVCVPQAQVSKQSFTWKHFTGPYAKDNRAFVAVEGERLVALICFVKSEFCRSADTFALYVCAIQATHPDFQRRGIMRELTLFAEKKLPKESWYLGFSNAQGVQIDRHSKHIAYHVVGQMQTTYMLSLPTFGGLRVRKVSQIPTSFVRSRQKADYVVGRVTPEYLRWRYDQNPKHTFEYLEVRQHETVLGYAVVERSGIFYNVYEVLGDTIPDVYRRILRAVSAYGLGHAILAVRYAYVSNSFWAAVQRGLTLQRSLPMYLTVKVPLAENKLQERDSWLIMGGQI